MVGVVHLGGAGEEEEEEEEEEQQQEQEQEQEQEQKEEEELRRLAHHAGIMPSAVPQGGAATLGSPVYRISELLADDARSTFALPRSNRGRGGVTRGETPSALIFALSTLTDAHAWRAASKCDAGCRAAGRGCDSNGPHATPAASSCQLNC